MPKLIVHDPETGKVVRMNGHKIRWTVSTFVAQDLGTEWYEMDAGEVSCTDEVHGEARLAVVAAERKHVVGTDAWKVARQFSRGKPSPDLSIAGMFYRSAHNHCH